MSINIDNAKFINLNVYNKKKTISSKVCSTCNQNKLLTKYH